MNTMIHYYFAYGSNLSSKRLFKRLPHAQCLGVAELKGHELTFNMLSKDGSAKCDITRTEAEFSRVLGVIYTLSSEELSTLDLIEGTRYNRVSKLVRLVNGEVLEAHCYIANTFHTDRLPFSWYKQHVLNGAREHCFPSSYIDTINHQTSMQDPDVKREQLELEIYK
ncbi:gamma-glutamylcyclotransferase family protein [Pseudoalteromonas luteoviolacea]|uniref:Gamma-glutamylcyclotransferase AIG2-like domain-containing protein n=1 Tax=Pseudoalteromonas luteoviolacea S4060-1 TaxID=1365257 RepID=A0A167NPE1_9GAMM|nr:gamma-glutamylcyclotransferase family protein [Pseudoalteromonas luteoviolacea]KZN68579.1 hypothetical protein N478_15550 [Pseudoalteromonas luteoviolacea S4060-1]